MQAHMPGLACSHTYPLLRWLVVRFRFLSVSLQLSKEHLQEGMSALAAEFIDNAQAYSVTEVRRSWFEHGSWGRGRSSLTVNGNGAWLLSWLGKERQLGMGGWGSRLCRQQARALLLHDCGAAAGQVFDTLQAHPSRSRRPSSRAGRCLVRGVPQAGVHRSQPTRELTHGGRRCSPRTCA